MRETIVNKYEDGEPCEHPGCLNHVTHPCEGCGRIAGKAVSAKFEERVAEWESRDDWQFADRAAERRFFFNAGVQDACQEFCEVEGTDYNICKDMTGQEVFPPDYIPTCPVCLEKDATVKLRFESGNMCDECWEEDGIKREAYLEELRESMK